MHIIFIVNMHFLSNSLHNPTPLSSRIGPSLSVDTKRRYDRCDRLFIIYGILCKHLITESKGTRPPLAGALRPPLQGARGIPADPAVIRTSVAAYACNPLAQRAFPGARPVRCAKAPHTLSSRTGSNAGNGEEARRGSESSPRRNQASAQSASMGKALPLPCARHTAPFWFNMPHPLPFQAMLTSRPRRTYPHISAQAPSDVEGGARTLERREKSKKDAAS